jgi:tRNA(Ile)-lysidine synthase
MNVHVVVAVSGGADSTALLVAFSEMHDFPITAAHINHHLRGAESDDDEAFVRDLCARLNVPLDVADGTLDPRNIKRSGIEAAARDVRTQLLLDIKRKRNARYVATAHQMNDQAETVLMRLFTGGGIAGLRGIQRVRDDGFIRPFLEVTRQDIDAFLRERDITPRVDSSNSDPRFLRNRIRMMLRDFDPSPIAAVAQQAQTLWRLVEREIDAIEVGITPDETRFIELPDDPLLRQALLHRHVRRLDPHSRDAHLARDLDSIKRTNITKLLELIRRDDQLFLRKIPQRIADYEFEIDAGGEVFIPAIGSTFRIGRNGGQPFQLPPGAKPHFTIRNRRSGDRFRPLGLGGHAKKLKNFLIDRKIPVEERDRIPLLIWNGEIVWVAGVEISDSFKITDEEGDRYEAAVQAEGRRGIVGRAAPN